LQVNITKNHQIFISGFYLSEAKVPIGTLASLREIVNVAISKNVIRNKIFDNLDRKDLLENIKILSEYILTKNIKKRKRKLGPRY